MIRKAARALRRLWPEALTAIIPFVLLLPLLGLTADWISMTLAWFTSDMIRGLSRPFGGVLLKLFFYLPNFAASIVAGLAFGIVRRKRALRLAWIFGIATFVTHGILAIRTDPSQWYFSTFHLAHVVLPPAAAAALLRWRLVIGAELGPTSASKRDPPGSKEYPLVEGVQGVLFLV